jgi:hypothetical protein
MRGRGSIVAYCPSPTAWQGRSGLGLEGQRTAAIYDLDGGR